MPSSHGAVPEACRRGITPVSRRLTRCRAGSTLCPVPGVSVLGPLRVDADGGTLGRRDRVVLAALSLRPGEAVSAERLADALWPDGVPASWNKVVQGCVVRLRRALGASA